MKSLGVLILLGLVLGTVGVSSHVYAELQYTKDMVVSAEAARDAAAKISITSCTSRLAWSTSCRIDSDSLLTASLTASFIGYYSSSKKAGRGRGRAVRILMQAKRTTPVHNASPDRVTA